MSDFIAQVTAQLDAAQAEKQLNDFLNQKRKVKIDVEVNQDSAKKMASSVEKGLNATKIDTSNLARQISDSFNLDKNVTKRIKSQMDSMVKSLSDTWNRKAFDFNKATGFYSGLSDLERTVTKNAKVLKSTTGMYDDFFNYFKNKKIYVSDELKKELGKDTYNELLKNNIGKIVRNASKGVSIDSLWGEMTSMFPEHFSDNITNQADQIVHAFDLVKRAREDMTQALSVNELKGADFTAMQDEIAQQVISSARQMKDALQNNILSEMDIAKTSIDLDVNVNADKITSDIKNAIQSAGASLQDGVQVDVKVNSEQLLSEMQNAIRRLTSGDEPVKVDVQINKESLQSDLNLALNDVDLPIHFNIDAAELESQIRAAVDNIQDITLDLRVNTDSVQDNIRDVIPDASGLTQIQQLLANANGAGRSTQNVFHSLGDSFREAFSAFTFADLITDGIYKIGDAARSAVDTVKEFNDVETDLAMATGENRGYIQDLIQGYNDLGQEIGSVTSDVATSADTWLRQGRNLSETNQLIKDSMILSKDTKVGSEEASKILTATLNGFQMEADQASHINDILTSIDLESAADAGGIGTALTKAASMANNAGLSLEKTAAMIATVKDVTQDSDASIGTSMKSILSRMNQIKAGKFVDAETGESLNDVEKVLGKVEISMRDVNGQFKDSEPILDDVAGKWDTFNANTKKSVATAMAGTYQYNKLIAMFDNWDKVQSLTNTALNSDGMAQKKFEENYLTSLEAKTNSLKASLEHLSTSLISSDLYGGFLDGSKAVVDFATNTDLLKSSLAGLGAAGGVFAFQQLVGAFRDLSDFSSALDLSKIANMSDDMFNSLLNLSQGLSQSQTRLLLSSDALSDAQRVAILMNQGMTDAQAQATIQTLGLSAAQGTAAASTVTLSGALSGLWSTLMANPLILVAAGVTAAVSAFSAYKRSVQEAVDSAKSAGNAWNESNTSIQDNIDKISELRSALSSGTLSEQEAANAKSELLSIQESLTESYGNQVAGIDLINGSLEEQIALLDKVSQQEAERFKNENKKGIENATKEMEKDRHTFLGTFYDNGTQESEAVKKAIAKLQKEYGKDTFEMSTGSDGITTEIHFTGDATEAEQALNNFMSRISDIEGKYGESDILDTFSDSAYSGLKEAKDVLEEYGDLYNQAQKASIVEDKDTFKIDEKEQTAAKWLRDYTTAIDNYNKALSEGNAEKISETASQFSAVDNAVTSLLKDTDMSAYADQFTEVREQLNESVIAANKFKNALSGKDSSDFGKDIQKNAEELKKLSLTDTDFKYAFETDGVQEGEDAIQGLVDAAIKCGMISDSSSGEVGKLISVLSELGYVAPTAAEGMENINNAASGMEEQITSAQTALESINAATSILSSQATGQSISLEDFNSDELKDYTSALEYNNGALQLNAEKVEELKKAKAKEAIQTNDNLKLEKQSQYMKNIKEIEQLQEQLRGLSDAKSENAEAIQSNIDSLLSENDSLVNQCNQLDLLSASLREATGAYQNWLDKQNTSEKGDMFDDALGAMEHIDEVTKDTDSEYYGRIGRESYKAAVEFIVPESIDSENAEAVSSYINSIEGHFKHDAEGSRIGLDTEEFCQRAVDQGLMVFDEASNSYQIAGQRTMQDFADGMNLAMPVVQAMFGEMEEFGAKWNWADEATRTLGDMGVAAGEAKKRIEELSGNENLDIQIDVSDIDSTEGKITALESTITQMQEYKGTLDVDSSQVDDANAVIQYCITQKQMLEAPAVMSVDTSKVDGEVGNAISLLQQFQEASNNVEAQAAIGADTSEAQGKVDSLVSEIQGLSPEVKAKLSLDGASQSTISASIQALTPEIMVKAGVDSAVVDSWAATKKESKGTVKWDNNTGAVDAWAATMHTSNGTVTWDNDISAVRTTFSATGTVNWTNTSAPKGGGHTLNGTAHVNGTAHYPHLVGHANASGNWGTKTGGVTLTGELGREIVVNPYTGTWRTVGDNGAEFTYIPKGSIVFNHLQTEELLKRGFVNSRGKANASGTAMVTGSFSKPQSQIASGDKHYNSSTSQNTQAVNQNTQAQNQNTQATSSNTDAAKKSTQAFDWVKNRLDYFAKRTQQIADQITDYVSYAIKKSRIMLQRASMDREIKAQQKGYEAYMKKAEQTASNYEYYDDNGNKKTLSIPKNYQDRAIYGKWSIEEMDTSTEYGKNLADAIQKFKEYTDAANECISSIQQLQNEQMELWADLVNIPLDEAEEKIDRISNAIEGLESAYDTISSGGSGISKLDNQILSDYGITKSEQRLEKAKKNERTQNEKRKKEKEKVEKADKNLKSEQSDLKKTDKQLNEEKKKTSKTINSVKFQAKKTGNKKVVDKVYDAIKNAEYIDLKGLRGEVRKSADKYNKQLKAQREVQKVRNSDKDTALQADKEAQQAQKNYDKANKKYQDAKKKRQEAQKDLKDRNNLLSDTQKEVIKNNGKPTFVTQNAILDAQYKQKKEESEAYEQAYWDSKSTVDKSKKEWDKKLAERNKKKDSLLKDGTITKNLSKAQLNAIKSGNLVDRTGISDPKTLEQINKWNKAVEEARKKENEYNIALKANEKAQANMAQSQAEYAQMAIENEQEKLENIKNYYTSQMDYEESLQKVRDSKVALNEAKGISKTDADIKNEKDSLLKRQKLAQQQAKDMQKQLDESVKKGIIKEGSEEWNKMQEMIHDCQIEANNLGVSIEELNNEMANLKIDQFEKLLDLLSAMQGYFHSIIDFIKSSGKFVMDDADAMKAYQDAIKNAGDMADNYQQQANEDWLNYEKALAASTEKEKQVYGGKSADEWKQAYYEDMKNMYDSKAEQHKLDWEVRELPLEELNAEFQNLKSTLDLIESGLDLKEAQGKYLSAMDYAKQQAALQEQIAKQEQINAHNKLLYEQASAIGADALASEYFDAWKSGEAEINSMQSSIEELADKIRDDFAEGCKRAIDSISDLRSVLESELDIKESQGKYLTKEDYEAQIRLNQDAYEQQMKLAADRYQKAQEARMAGNEAEADQLISEARKAEAEANKLLAANEELQKQIQNLFRDTIQRELDALEAAMKVIESEVNLKQAQDRDLDKADYDKQIESKLEMIKKQSALARENERLYNLEVSKGNMQAAAEYLQAWKDAEAEVNNLRGDIEELGDEMRKTLLTKELDEMLEKLDAFRKSISTITGMISEDMMFDKNGHLTDFGTASLALNLKEYESQTDSLKTLMDKRQKYIDEFNNGKNEHYSQNEFDEDMKNITSEIQDMLSNASDSRQAIIDMITKTSKMEIDALSEVIDKRKELLQAQKDAYNFDKSLKSQTNDLTMLMKQKEALEGLTDKESQAKLQKLNQQIKEAQEALNDTITDHSFDLKIEGLDDLKESISDAYEDYVKELNSNLDAITDAVGNATDMVVGALGSVENAIDKLLQSFGVSGLDKDVIGYDKPHKPTEKPNTNETTNATRKSVNTLTLSDGTVLIPYHADEHSLLNTDVTQKLIDNINSMQTMPTFEMPKLDVKELVRNGSESNPDVIIKDIGGIHVYDATDPNAIMGVIHKNIKTVAKDVGTEFSKNVSKVGNKRTWG